MENPFKFGTIVEADYFTDRKEEVAYIRQFIESRNHLVLISPRRFGKSSVVLKAVKSSARPYVMVNLQQMASAEEFAAQLLRGVYRVHPFERIRQFIVHFRIIPTLSTNPVTGQAEVSFQPTPTPQVLLEDVLNLIERLSEEHERMVVILDEFQEVLDIAPKLDKHLRSIMQLHQHVNYILLGSQESMMEDIFEKKKSPFYHFGMLMRLRKLPREDFRQFIVSRMQAAQHERSAALADQILDYTDCHPYYTQQLAAQIWQTGVLQPEDQHPFDTAVRQIVETHSLDYERLWTNFTRTEKWLLKRLSESRPIQTGEFKTSTLYSALKKMQKAGYVIYTSRYEVEDPFFKEWIAAMAG